MLKIFFSLLFFIAFIQNGEAQNDPTISVCGGGQKVCATSDSQMVCIKIILDPTYNKQIDKYTIDWGDFTPKTTIVGSLTPANQVHYFSLKNFFFTCNDNKKYFITLATFEKGKKDPVENIIPLTIINPPIARFSLNPNPACVGQEVSFSNSSCPSTGLSDPKIDYGDGSPTTMTVLKHTYNAIGTYNVKLSVSNECGNDTKSQSISILEKPIAQITPDSGFVKPLTDPLKVCLGGGGYARLNGTKSQNATSYKWDIPPVFGWQFTNNSNLNNSILELKFAVAGNYTATLTVKNPCGAESKKTVSITVIAADNLQLFAQVDACKSLSYKPLPFNAKAEYYINGKLETNFPLPLSVGKYKVIAKLENECGKQEETDEFDVLEPEVVTIQLPSKDTSICLNSAKIELLAQPSGGTWTGAVNIEKVGGKTFFNPLKSGNFSLTYTRGTGSCEQKASVKITVLDDVKFSLPHQLDACRTLDYTPQDYNPAATYEIDGVVVTKFPITFPASAKKHIVIATLSGNCGKQILKDSFTVLLPQKIEIDNNLPKEVCASAQNIALKSSVSSASWLLNGALISSSFAPATAKIGQNTIIAKDDSGCSIPDTAYIMVIDDAAKIKAINAACINGAAQQLDAMPTNGTWKGTGVSTTGLFSPKSAGIGKHTISYSLPIPKSVCIARDSVEIEVFAPSVSFDVSNCESTKITFQPNVNGSISSLYWSFGDSQNSNEKGSVTHEYAKEGSYTVTLKGSIGGCDTTFAKTISVEAPAFAAFDMPDEICEGVAINLKNNSKGTSLTYEWRVGNTVINSTSTAPQGLLYPVGQDTVLIFSVSVSNGCSKSTESKTLKIKALPDANFGSQYAQYCSGQKVYLQNSSKNATNYIWKNSQGILSTEATIDTQLLFTKVNPTTFPYWLIAKNTCGTDSVKREIIVNPTDVKAFFGISKKQICVGEPLEVKSYATPNAPFKFDMGDGNSYQNATFQHAFAKAGKYTIIQKVFGCGFDTSMLNVTVLPLPELAITTNSPICLNDLLATKVTTNGISVKLQYGNGDSSNLFINKYLYQKNGTFSLTIIANSQDACQTKINKDVTVHALPLVDFEVVPSPCQFAPVLLKSTNQGIDYEFHSGDGNISDKEKTIFRYNQPGLFKPYLVLTDANGCRDSITKQILVKASPKADFEVENNFACPPIDLKINDLSKGAISYQYTGSNGFLSNDTKPSINIKDGGTYFIRQVVSNGICNDTIKKQTYVKKRPQFTHGVKHISCFGKGDAVISIFDKDTTDFFSVSGSNYTQSGVTRYEPLQKGTYILTVKSIDGCFAHDTARVFEPQEIKLKISDKSLIKLNYGGVDTLKIISNKNNLLYQWNTKQGFFKEYSPTLIGISPEENVLYQLRGTDDNGCEAFAQVAVEVNKRFPIYIPNTFSPNEDGKNDSFTIFADPEDVSEILSFQIYDKWGAKVFQKQNFQPNIEAEGWNGSNYNNNVFVYQALILFKDGTEVLFKGDVMLLK
jgi:PKD repeat protein